MAANNFTIRFVLSILLLSGCITADAIQTITLDFDTFTDPVEDPDDYVYAPEERDAILSILQETFRAPPGDPMGGMFGLEFEILDPLAPPVPFTTSIVKFNAGLFGSAEGIDFRNQNDADDANVHAVPTLKLFTGSSRIPELGGGVWTEPDLLMPENVVVASAQIAAHEVGHLLGLRHHDAFGPLGKGIGVSASAYSPAFPGPTGTTLTSQHIMGLNSAVALNANNLLTPSHFNMRSTLKMSLAAIENEIGPNPYVVDESEYPGGDGSDSVMDADTTPIPLMSVPVPNLLESPHPWAPLHGGPELLPATMGVMTGEIEDRGAGVADADHFEIEIFTPSFLTVEVISEQNTNTTEIVDPNLAILDAATGALLPYYSGESLTKDQFESTDAIIFDMLLAPGTYVVEVFPETPGDTGDYELLVYTFPDIEFPLTGDYNEDGFVDAADYTIWRDNLGTSFILPNRDPGLGGDVSFDDYLAWADNFGEFKLEALDPAMPSFTSASASSVPEPSSGLLCFAAGLAAVVTRRR